MFFYLNYLLQAAVCSGVCCVPFFLFAVALDVVGVILLFVGIFANLRLDGRFYGDFLIYTGALVVFFSLGCWLMWYVGNVPVSEDDGLRKTSSIVRLARKLSERLSQTLNPLLKVHYVVLETSHRCICLSRMESQGGCFCTSSPHQVTLRGWMNIIWQISSSPGKERASFRPIKSFL
uniref:Transmembrane protein 238a n=1 Tax=Sparus aurata TaxID=8175 RepID=A0A671X2S1_SPAAU